MHRCEIKRNSACRRESSSHEAAPLREAERSAGAVHLQVGLAFRSQRKTSRWRSLPPARRSYQSQVRMASGIQIPTTIWRLPCILPASPASEPKMKATMVKALLALQQPSPVPRGIAWPLKKLQRKRLIYIEAVTVSCGRTGSARPVAA
jgi:hypothetical protein